MQGPYSVNRVINNPSGKIVEYEKRTWYRTTKGQPRVPLPYNAIHTKATGLIGNNWGLYESLGHYYLQATWGRSDTIGGSMAAVNNKAYSKFLAARSSQAAMGVNLVEYRQTIETATTIINSLRHPLQTFANVARRYARRAGMPGGTLQRTLLKDLGGVWLAFHFGVEPLYKDLYSTMERLEQQNYALKDWRQVTVSSQSKWRKTTTSNDGWSVRGYENYHGIVKIGCEVRVKSSDLALANDFGLVNPFTLAWELVPFSFVVDWLWPVGSYLNSMTDFCGYETRNPYTTWFLSYRDSIVQGGFQNGKDYRNGVDSNGFRFERALTSPAFRPPPFQLPMQLSITRAVTAISLLLQFVNQPTFPLRR